MKTVSALAFAALLSCTSNAQCPEEQRCVEDGAHRVCHGIVDGDGF
jgi:hypothetical protein